MDKRRMCPNCRAFITTDDKVCPYCDLKIGPRAIDKRSPPDAIGGISHEKFATYTILLINIGLYLVTTLRSAQASGGFSAQSLEGIDNRTLAEFGAKFGPAIAAGQWWRLITAGFLHGGILHIFMNSWVLLGLGPQVDQVYGTRRFLVIYFVSNFTGFLASFYWVPYISVGASAGLCGLIGAMIAYTFRDKSSYAQAMLKNYLVWVGIILVQGFLLSAIDNAAHIGGLIGGFAVGFLAGTPSFSEAKETFWRIAAGVVLALTAYAFFDMFVELKSSI